MTKKREKQLQAIASRCGGSNHAITIKAERQRDIFDPNGDYAWLNDRQFISLMNYIAAVVHDTAIAIGFYDSRIQPDKCIQDRWS